MRHRELDRGAPDRRSVAGANRFDLAHAIHDFLWRGRVLELGLSGMAPVARIPELKTPASITPIFFSTASGRNSARRSGSRASSGPAIIATSKSHGAREPDAGVGFVIPKPFAATVFSLRSLSSAPVGAFHRFLETARRIGHAMRPDVAVVDQKHIQPIKARAQQRLFDRTHRPVVRIVKTRCMRIAAGEAGRIRVLVAPGGCRRDPSPADLG